MTESTQRPDYGIDAPGVVRNLFVVAGIGLVIWVITAAGLWSGVLQHKIGGINFILPVGHMAPWFFLTFTFIGLWMVWSSKFGATGIDIWQSEDLSGNRPESTLDNASREGVRDRVDVQTADMRKMPFPDATFDVVVSCAAIHNLYKSADRAQAIAEIARVLKPGCYALIDDIRHASEYTAAFAAHGCREVRHVESRAGAILTTVITLGSLRPVKLVVRKNAAR